MKATVFSSFGQIDRSHSLSCVSMAWRDAGPKHDAVFLEVMGQDFEAAVGFLEGERVGDARAGVLAGPHEIRRFENERAIDDQQRAIARRPDLERGQAVLDLAGLPDVANRTVDQGLDILVGHDDAVVRQRCGFPERFRPLRALVSGPASVGGVPSMRPPPQ